MYRHIVRTKADVSAALARHLAADAFERRDEAQQLQFRGVQLMRELVDADRKVMKHPLRFGNAGSQLADRTLPVPRQGAELDSKERRLLSDIIMQLAANPAPLCLLGRDEFRRDIAERPFRNAS